MAQRYLHGIHDIGAEDLHGDKPGWTLDTVAVGLDIFRRGNDYRHISDRGIGVIVRLNNGYGSAGTIPLPQDYDLFAGACANFAATSQGVDYFIIANEVNHEGERPNGVVITPEHYAACYNECYAAIKNLTPQAKVMHAAMAPYHANPTKWTEYLNRVLRLISWTDGINVHAYTRSMNPEMITSDLEMGPPLEGTFSGFRTYEDAFEQVPANMLHLPAFITEFDVYGDWENRNTGVFQAMYDDVQHWNSWAGQYPKIVAALGFRWLGPPDVENAFDWEIRNKPELIADFREAVAIGYKSPEITGASDEGEVIFLPDISTGGESTPVAEQRNIDPRATQRGVKIETPDIAPGAFYWFVEEVKWYNEQEADRLGPDHHIMIDVVDAAGQRMVGVPITVTWPSGNTEVKTEAKPGEPYSANFAMTPGEFSIQVRSTVPAEKVTGIEMGQDTPDGFNPGIHTTTGVRYRWKMKPLGTSTPTPTPVPVPVQVPPLFHPVEDARFRTPSQVFGARPEYYKQFKIDGVPLKGHEGIDFPTPVGSRITAVDDGNVAEVANQGEVGYGKYIKVVHSWGETVYAHLEEQWVTVGQRVGQGEVIGRTGDTGNADGAHLHFGLRVKPFNRQDGWGGYSNPALYLNSIGSGPTPTPVPSPDRNALVNIVKQAASEFALDWRLITSLIHGESSFNPLSKNSVTGAAGLGNIMPSTWAEWSKKVGARNIFDARDNARVTAAYLNWCIQTAGSIRKGLWAYNWGIGNVLEGRTPPPETIEFASKVIHGMDVLRIVNP